MILKIILYILIVCGAVHALEIATPESSATSSDENTTTSATPTHLVTTTIAPELECQSYNSSCEECVKHPRCYYCYSTNVCLFYPFSSAFPSSRDCDMGEMRWGVCWFNFKALIISLGVMGGVLFVSLCCCIYCCCRRKKKTGISKQDAKYEREREARRIQSDERKQDRKQRNDEIRRKYGLIKDEQPYQRFEA